MKKSWQEKLGDSKDLPRVEKIDEKKSKRWGSGTFVIPAPIEVDAVIRKGRSKHFMVEDFEKSVVKMVKIKL